MAYFVTQEDVLSVRADAVVVCLENTMTVSEDAASQRLGEAGGVRFQEALRHKRFLPVGSACAVDPSGLPFRHVLATGAPQWRLGEANEFLVLHRCYQSLYALAKKLDCSSVAMPFLSAAYYRFPQEDAVQIAREEAECAGVETIFLAQTAELYALSQKPYRKPQIVSYIGYYRDHAVFKLDNGLFARVDLRPEIRDVNIRPYVEACYYTEADPSLPALPEREIARVRSIYELI